jgi:hypothetical protein
MKNIFVFNWMPLLCGVFATGLAFGQGSSAGVEKFEGGKFPGFVVDEVVVPVPSEIFAVLDKLGSPNWKDELRKVKLPETSDRIELSLVFGDVVAEGFVAVQAQDKQTVEDIGRDVINLAASLGLTKAVRPHAQSILDAVKKNDWKGVRKELDQTQTTVRASMQEMRDDDLSQCVSFAGWLRGTASVTSVISKAFTEDRAELMNQPMLVEHFTKSIAGMSPSARKHPSVAAIAKGLLKIHQDMESKDGNISQDKVNSIKATCEELLTLINKPEPKKGK